MADNSPVIHRGPGGQFLSGISANPSGRPKGVGEIRELARQYVPAALAKIAGLINSEDEKVALAASQEILNRVFGRPLQAVEAKTETWNMGALWLEAMKLGNAKDSTTRVADSTPLTIDHARAKAASPPDRPDAPQDGGTGENRW
jgi:hypothetical protein